MRRLSHLGLLLAALTLVPLSAGAALAQDAPGGAPAPPSKPAPKPPPPSRLFWGGGLGLSFGDVDYVSVNPWLGYWFHPRVAGGVGFEYVYRNDKRTSPDLSTTDYGGSVFTRVTVARDLFVGAEYEYLRYERYTTSTQKVSDDYSSVFVGGGIARPMGGKAA